MTFWPWIRSHSTALPGSPEPRVSVSLALGILSTSLSLSCAEPSEPNHETALNEDFAWGIYQIYWGASRYDQMIEESVKSLASAPDIIMFYRDLGRGFPRGGCEVVDARGATPMLSLELWHWGGGRDHESLLPTILTGGYDDFFQAYARDAKAYGKPVYLRFGFEMNGDWFSWGNQPPEFKAAWQHAHAIFSAEGADNVIWVWAPNFVSIPRENNPIESYYPGDEFVDWVGVDGYNFGDHHDQWHSWESFTQVFDPALALFAERYPDKPVMLAEFGSAPGNDGAKAAWIREAYDEISQRPEIGAAVWFNLDKRTEGEPNWRIDSDPGSLEAFNRTFAQPR